jgi:hypothetical protein
MYKDLRRTGNTMAIRQRTNNDVQRSKKDRQYNGHKTKDKNVTRVYIEIN